MTQKNKTNKMLQKFNPKNADIKVYINGEIVPRNEAKVSVFDSVVQGGDAVWEGIRVYDGRVFALNEHLERLINSARAMAFRNIPTKAFVKKAIFDTLKANNMSDGVHIRLTLTRGEKITSGMDPRLNQKGLTLIVLAEYKAPVYDKSGITLITASVRRNSPQFVDSKIHHNNLINNIMAKIEANHAGADSAIMLDAYGFVAEANGTNIFMVKNGIVHTPTADACLPGITRQTVINLARKIGLTCLERNISIAEFYMADEVFTTGTMGEIVNVTSIDGRKIYNNDDGEISWPISQKIQAEYAKLTAVEGDKIV